jgi:cold shock CspA family protein
MIGTVSFYNRLRGWGFVIPDDRSQSDAFIHVKNLPPDHRYLNEGDRISYEPGAMCKGRPEARKIEIIEVAAVPTAGVRQ